MNILTMRGMSIQNVINSQGGIGMSSQYEKLKEDVATLLLTRKGSVIGNPGYGSNLYTYIFSTITDTEVALISEEITEILRTNYNFIRSVIVDLTITENTLNIKIQYETQNVNLSAKLEFNIPLNSEGGIDI